MVMIFDGKAYALEKEKELKIEVAQLRKKKITPKLVAILVGNDPASKLYVSLKKKAAERIGIKFSIFNLQFSINSQYKISQIIEKCNADDSIYGIMIQLPLPGSLRLKTKSLINTITPEKDVDGLRADSSYVPAAAKAVSDIVKSAIKPLAYVGKKATVIGAKGTTGKAVVRELSKLGFKVAELDRDTRDLYAKLHEADLIVSATGVHKLIKPEMIKEGVIAIDVGAPKGDFDPSAKFRTSFFTPVPGGVGPVTVISLMENLVEAAEH